MRPGLGEAKALRGTAGQATAPVTALPEWTAPTRAPRERARSVSLETCFPPTPAAVSTRGTGETADPQDAVAGLGGTGIAPWSRTCEAPGAASVAGGAQPQRAAARAPEVYLPPADRPKVSGGRRSAPTLGKVQVPTPTTVPAHSPGAQRRKPAQSPRMWRRPG